MKIKIARFFYTLAFYFGGHPWAVPPMTIKKAKGLANALNIEDEYKGEY